MFQFHIESLKEKWIRFAILQNIELKKQQIMVDLHRVHSYMKN